MSSQREIGSTETLALESTVDAPPSQEDVGTAETLPLKGTLLAMSHLGTGGVETLPLEGAIRALASQPAMTLPPEDPIRALASQPAMTLPRDGAGEPLTPAAAPPVTTWDRYEVLELLGKGGMGSVYRARDRRLDRTLAIKFLLGADPNLTVRFLREARAQARIDHPNVCRVYEVGEIAGRAYIALQIINGQPLHKAAARMSLDEKVAVMRDVAVAVQEAHRLGIVHRDLKPANIMVERTDDGRWFAVVMDFGLAREATIEASLTESGTVIGTPAYMSPEQAIGDVHAIDRRSDVYSLGATLYELLTGQPPFATTSLAQMLAQVIHDDPPAPRSRVASLPGDLETIALKCLAKDPTQRYPSARALADDLTRYLDGEPILGRRLSRWQRLRRYARRRRALVVLGAWSLVIILAVASLGVRAWLISRTERARTNERTRLAQQLGSEAKDIESFLTSAYQRPLHNTREDLEHIRAQMRAIAATHHDLGDLGDAFIHYALGRGYLALHQWREAHDELSRAALLQTPELHAALGRALGELYHRALEDARHSDDKRWFARRHQELVEEYLTPALAELQQSRGASDDSELLEAQIAFYRGDFANAEKLALATTARAPWLFEGRRLAADAAYSTAIKALDHGDYDPAQEALERASALYAEASEFACSDASLYQRAAETWLQRAEVGFRLTNEPREPLAHALDVIDLALRADPEDAAAYTTKAYVLLLQKRKLTQVSPEQQRLLLDQSEQAAARAVKLDPGDAATWDGLGIVHYYLGTYEYSHGHGHGQGEGASWWSRARDEFAQELAIHPNDPQANSHLGMAHRFLGTSLDEAGRDPMPEYQGALRSYERAATLDPQYLKAWTNQADLYVTIVEHDLAVGADPEAAVDHALHAGERCLAIDPHYYAALDTMAQVQLAHAHYLVDTGGDPTAALANARAYLARSESAQPRSFTIWFDRFAIAGAEAKFRLREGADPTSSIVAGRAAREEALRLRSDSIDFYIEAARFALQEAAWAARTGGEVTALLDQARASAEKAITIDSQFADAQLAAAEVCLEIAKAQRSRTIAERGIAHVDQALKLNSQLSQAPKLRAELLRVSAR